MATIVIHAGMPKTGSTSIQLWLRDNGSRLREEGFTLVVAPFDHEHRIEFVPFEEGKVNSEWIVRRALGKPKTHEWVGRAFAAALADAAARLGNIVVSGEHLAPLFSTMDRALPALQQLAQMHNVRVAYYARPQHTALEADWQERGYRSGKSPSVYLRRRASSLHYAMTRAAVGSRAAALRFQPRPFRRDLLKSGDVVADFTHHFLGVDAGKTFRVNQKLPLEVVNLLSASYKEPFAFKEAARQRRRSRQLLEGCVLPEESRIALSRRVLQKYAHERFADENAELGWPDFIPPPEGSEELPGIEALDELWKPQASPAELALLFKALDAAIDKR